MADANFLERHGFLSAEVFRCVLDELKATLHLIDSRLRKADNFDIDRFHQDVAAAIAKVPTADAELRDLKDVLDRERKARFAAMDPWEQLDVDWDRFHPRARSLLNDPSFWSETNGFSPHGNDTGADLLAEFRKWNRKHADKPAHRMAHRLLQSWGIAEINRTTVDVTVVESILGSDPIALSVTDDALIAVAFAAAKIRGHCDSETRELANAAIERERMPSVLVDRGWTNPEERLRTLGIIRNQLGSLPDRPS